MAKRLSKFQADSEVVILSLGLRATISEVLIAQSITGDMEIVGYRLGGGVSPVTVTENQISLLSEYTAETRIGEDR